MRTLRPLALAVATLSLTLAFTACSVNVVDGTKPSAGSEKTPPQKTDEKTTPSTAPSEDAEEQSSPDGDGIDRQTVIAAATTVKRCDGELTLTQDAAIIRVEGACDRVILNATGSQLVTDDVAYLEVIGDGNVVLSGTVDKLLVNGNSNLVHWQGTTPAVTDVGSANVLTAG